MASWTKDKIAALGVAIRNGHTYGEIARMAEFEGFSRSALIGMASRAGFGQRDRTATSKHAAAHRKALTNAADAKAKRAKAPTPKPAPSPEKVAPPPAPETPRPVQAPEVPEPAAGVNFMDTLGQHCRWPLWPTGSRPRLDGMDVCGRRTITGKSWCAEHKRLAYQPSTPRPLTSPGGRASGVR